MVEWVTLRNIERFKQMLGEEKDPDKRRILEMLLAEQEERRRQADEKEGR